MKKDMTKAKHIVRMVCGLLVICFISTGAVYDAAGTDVTIKDINEFDNTQNIISTRTRSDSVDEIIDSTNIKVGLFDKVESKPSENDEKDIEIIIKRGVDVTINVDGSTIMASATKKLVGDALLENGILLNETDYTVPGYDEPVSSGMTISVVRVYSETEERTETIPFETKNKNDDSLYVGESKVQNEGVNGVISITESVTYENGAEVSRTEVLRQTLTEKTDKVVLIGTKKKPAPSTSPKSIQKASSVKASKNAVPEKSSSEGGNTINGYSYSKVMTMNSTGYSAYKKGGGYGTTATGVPSKQGVVAVDPRVIPLGTKLYVEGYGYAVAADTGGVIKGNKIDLCFEKSDSEIRQYGRRNIKVYILK